MALTRDEYVNGLQAEIDALKKQLHETRLDLLASDAIREALHAAARDTAGSMARALALTEVAFYAGHEHARLATLQTFPKTREAAYRDWTASLKEPS